METEMIDQELPGKLEIKIVSRPSSQAQRIWRKRGRPRDLRSQAGFQPIAAHLIAVSLITTNTQYIHLSWFARNISKPFAGVFRKRLFHWYSPNPALNSRAGSATLVQ